MRRLFSLCIISCLNFFTAQTFNFDPKPTLVIRSPDNDGSLFGYTIRLGGVTEYGSDLPRIVIGAPKAKTIGSDGSYMETGAIYLYNWNNRTERIKIENATGLKINASLWPISYPQWLGGVLDDVNGLDKIITCAPNFQSISSHETLSFHGACYIIDADLRGGSSKLKILSPFSAADEVKNQIYITADKLNIPNLILGQFGFSVRYNKGSDEYLFGAPGVLGWSGATVHYDGVKKIFAKQIPTKNTGSYGGYAVDYGYFDKTKENNYITTIPYGGISSKLGKALIYRRKGKKYFHRAKLSGEQYGEFYGYALLVDDLTGDGLDDILISAPFHSMRGSFDAGAVYMYINQGAENQLLFKQSLLMSPFSKGGRFGTALSKLGDINRDGYNDVAIGAPSSGYHSEGAVAIYFGGPNGLESQPRQILKALPQLVGMNAMFGLGLSNGVYYHSNSFAVGAPNVDRVFYYSSYPVVKINASLEATNAFIPLNATQVEINICVNFLTNFTHLESLVVLFDLKADSSYGRISIGVCIDELITVRLKPKCFVCQPNITSDEASVFVPMLFELSYLLYNNTKSSKDSEFCKECAVVDPSFPNVTRTTIQYLHDCEGNVCVVDLQLRSVDIPNKITLGSAKHLPIKYNISNVGEKALYTKLIISSSLSIPIMRMPAECAKELDVDWRVVCSIAQRQAFAGNTEIELNLDISEIAGAKYVIINAVAYSAGNELTPDNNRVSNRIELITSAEIWITESSAGDIISIKDAADTVGITRSYIIQNSGPSSLKTPHLIVEFPISQKSKGDSFEYYVSNYSAQVRTQDFLYPLEFGESKPTMTAKVNGTEFLNINHIPNEQTIFLSCQPNLDMLCSLSNFTLLGLFKPEKNLTLTLQYTIHLKVLEKLILANKDNLAHVVTLDLKPAGELRGFLNIKKRINAVLVVKISKRSVLWIYIVASLGGLLLLTCISLLLKRRGFFKRLSKEDMEQTFKENEEKALMHKSLDECVAEMEETEQELPDVECTKK